MDKSQNLIWIDLEMTGLKPDTDRIIEIATLVTDADLNILAEGPVLAISQSEQRLAAMDDWNQLHHGQSGLIDRVKNSTLDEAARRSRRSTFCHVTQTKTPPRCVVTASVRTGAFWRTICLSWKHSFTIAIWMSVHSRSWSSGGAGHSGRIAEKGYPSGHGRHQGFGERADLLPGTFLAV